MKERQKRRKRGIGRKVKNRGRGGERERAGQYRGDVLRASCKRVVSWILWTLHGETTTKTKWIPERERERARDRQKEKTTTMCDRTVNRGTVAYSKCVICFNVWSMIQFEVNSISDSDMILIFLQTSHPSVKLYNRSFATVLFICSNCTWLFNG